MAQRKPGGNYDWRGPDGGCDYVVVLKQGAGDLGDFVGRALQWREENDDALKGVFDAGVTEVDGTRRPLLTTNESTANAFSAAFNEVADIVPLTKNMLRRRTLQFVP